MSGWYEVEGEVHTDKGRIDAVLKKGIDVIVVEIKYGKETKVEQLLKEAMEHIKEKKYYEKYASSEVSLLLYFIILLYSFASTRPSQEPKYLYRSS
jgi:hypothetical protein